jgi:hypothetical protein
MKTLGLNQCLSLVYYRTGLGCVKTTTKPVQVIDEPKKSINCKYIGSTIVDKSSGMDTLNDAIWKTYKMVVGDIDNDDDDSVDVLDGYAGYAHPDAEHQYPDTMACTRKMIDIELTVSPSKIYAMRSVCPLC